jgi:uncharacterized protein YbjQ (UPF0145 family)
MEHEAGSSWEQVQVARGSAAAGAGIAQDRAIFFGAAWRNVTCTQLLEKTRRHAIDRMDANATAMGANAVVMMRFDSTEIGQTMSEIVAYGTAVVLEPA